MQGHRQFQGQRDLGLSRTGSLCNRLGPVPQPRVAEVSAEDGVRDLEQALPGEAVSQLETLARVTDNPTVRLPAVAT